MQEAGIQKAVIQEATIQEVIKSFPLFMIQICQAICLELDYYN